MMFCKICVIICVNFKFLKNKMVEMLLGDEFVRELLKEVVKFFDVIYNG